MPSTSDELERSWREIKEQLLSRMKSIATDYSLESRKELIESELNSYLDKMEGLIDQCTSELEEDNIHLKQKINEHTRIEPRILFLDRVLRSLTAIN